MASTHGSHLSQHDVLRDTAAVVEFTNSSSLEKNFDRLLERTTHESTSVGTVDTVTSDGRDAATVGHDIDKSARWRWLT